MDNNQKEVPDLPLGFGMALAQDTEALVYFGSLDLSEQQGIVRYIQSSNTGNDAKNRIRNAVDNLKNRNTPQMF